MLTKWKSSFLCGWILLCALSSPAESATQPFVYEQFLRGNLHAHTNRTDGDVPPERLIQAYEAKGYQFLAITDHNLTTPPGAFESAHGPGFVVLSGNEVSDAVRSKRPRHLYDRPYIAVHGNALCVSEPIQGLIQPDIPRGVMDLARRIRQVGALLQLNHPNYESSFTHEEMFPLEGPYLLEISNMHPDVRNGGEGWWPGDVRPSTEQIWDELLARGRRVYGTATDDVHDLIRDPGFEPRRPFRGWVQVAAAQVSEPAICAALREGRFYSSTGVELSRVAWDGQELSVEIRVPSEDPFVPMTQFISDGGVVRHTAHGRRVRYRLRGGENYLRAAVYGKSGRKAWVQPVFPH